MPKDEVIRKKAIEILTETKWVSWYAPKVKFHETDIFGIADLICCSKKELRLIQLTTVSNISARRNKIKACLKKSKMDIPIEIWGWNGKKREFKKEIVRRA